MEKGIIKNNKAFICCGGIYLEKGSDFIEGNCDVSKNSNNANDSRLIYPDVYIEILY